MYNVFSKNIYDFLMIWEFVKITEINENKSNFLKNF